MSGLENPEPREVFGEESLGSVLRHWASSATSVKIVSIMKLDTVKGNKETSIRVVDGKIGEPVGGYGYHTASQESPPEDF
jgi:hypothetical protein